MVQNNQRMVKSSWKMAKNQWSKLEINAKGFWRCKSLKYSFKRGARGAEVLEFLFNSSTKTLSFAAFGILILKTDPYLSYSIVT